ncbi:PTS transporter subunit EIIB [Vibrio chagasii]|nr:PTS transporter subunit EIIB [Vibrio chagasii]
MTRLRFKLADESLW